MRQELIVVVMKSRVWIMKHKKKYIMCVRTCEFGLVQPCIGESVSCSEMERVTVLKYWDGSFRRLGWKCVCVCLSPTSLD